MGLLGYQIIDLMSVGGVLSLPSNLKNLPQPISLEPDQSPLMVLEEWFQNHLP